MSPDEIDCSSLGDSLAGCRCWLWDSVSNSGSLLCCSVFAAFEGIFRHKKTVHVLFLNIQVATVLLQ